ncbi:YicC/YloC family endoribonuclease [Candidatus Halobeggiatoa sp. HSG11]|nr:YicC/YloC family endoribonuclease [Candidatus Halobeggiatoa sp. HSG11]
MIRSMTAFARTEWQASWGQLYWEMRSVNHRYLDISVRLPENFRCLEIKIREHIKQHVKRGKVDCNLHLQLNEKDNKLQVNLELAEQLGLAIQQINTVIHNVNQPNAIDILNWQGVLEAEAVNTETIEKSILEQLDIGLKQLIDNREREGNQLTILIEQRCASIGNEVKQIRHELPMILQAQRERLQTRLTELIELDSERIEQEIVILVQKMDIAEELDRLDAHLLEMDNTLKKQQIAGRRLDFLAQELHREANTLGAKSNHIITSNHAVELKVLIDQIREQIQNIE